jgi:hypothetical protein
MHNPYQSPTESRFERYVCVIWIDNYLRQRGRLPG